MLGPVYAHVTPRRAYPLKHAEHVCVCVVEMEHDVFWGPEEKTLLVCEWPGKGRGPALGM